MQRKKYVSFGSIILVAGVALGMTIGSVVSENTLEHLKKLESAYLLVNESYVDQVSAKELAESAIKGMLEDMDPHSVYITAEDMKRVNEQFDASFEGIGISYELIGPEDQDTIAVISVIPGGPSEGAGLMSGDRIINIDGSSAVGFSTEDVQNRLKGPRGTKVQLAIRRPGFSKIIEQTITRDRIPLYTVESSYMVDDRTGYIKLDRFARTTYAEFMEAMNKLKRSGMERLIFDLRGNAGGYMDMAVKISDEFLGDGQVIVSAKSRHNDFNQEFVAKNGGSFEDEPVILLVDENSASASEIVAGALQDHDRALVIGRRTFGKGLVQRQYALADGSAIRLTISRYFTPSGRLIQTAYENGDRDAYYESKRMTHEHDAGMDIQDILAEVPDSLKYRTDGGRTVLGGGGILPDYIVPLDSASTLVRTVVALGVESEFVREFMDQHGDELRRQWSDNREAFLKDFRLSDAAFSDFLAEAGEDNIRIVDGPKPDAGTDETVHYFTQAEVSADRKVIETRLKAQIGTRLFDRSIIYPVYQDIDNIFERAMQMWNPAEALALRYPID